MQQSTTEALNVQNSAAATESETLQVNKKTDNTHVDKKKISNKA
jgi:hypothetical protein